jgi:hypothetical protein
VPERDVEAASLGPVGERERARREAEPLGGRAAAAVAADRLVRDAEALEQPERLREVARGHVDARATALERADHRAHDEHVGRVG